MNLKSEKFLTFDMDHIHYLLNEPKSEKFLTFETGGSMYLMCKCKQQTTNAYTYDYI